MSDGIWPPPSTTCGTIVPAVFGAIKVSTYWLICACDVTPTPDQVTAFCCRMLPCPRSLVSTPCGYCDV